MNTIIIDNTPYFIEGNWRSDISKKTYDDKHVLFPYPKPKKYWGNRAIFLSKLSDVEESIKSSYVPTTEPKSCLLCSRVITNGTYTFNNIKWDDGYKHYIEKHDIVPTKEFQDFIFTFYIKKKTNTPLFKFKGTLFYKQDIRYIKLEKNQLMILDALLKHGSYTKKYFDKIRQGFFPWPI